MNINSSNKTNSQFPISNFRRNTGAALLITMMIIATVGALALIIGRIAITQSHITTSYADSVIAYENAENCIEQGLLFYKNNREDEEYRIDKFIIGFPDAGKCILKMNIVSNCTMIEATGVFNRSERKLTAMVNKQTNKVIEIKEVEVSFTPVCPVEQEITSWIVSGAGNGTSTYNGTYNKAGITDFRPYYPYYKLDDTHWLWHPTPPTKVWVLSPNIGDLSYTWAYSSYYDVSNPLEEIPLPGNPWWYNEWYDSDGVWGPIDTDTPPQLEGVLP